MLITHALQEKNFAYFVGGFQKGFEFLTRWVFWMDPGGLIGKAFESSRRNTTITCSATDSKNERVKMRWSPSHPNKKWAIACFFFWDDCFCNCSHLKW